MAVKGVDQLGMDETVVDDPALEQALDEREDAKEAAGRSRRWLEEKHTLVLGMLEALDLVEGPVRVGKYRIAKVAVPSRAVSFETEASERIRIGVVGDDDA